MSNPGVITLADGRIGQDFLKIEDNIGEKIHLHYGAFRIDLTIAEFLDFAETMVSIMEGMVAVEGFSFQDYDSIFLSQIYKPILDLRKIEFEEVPLDSLLTYAKDPEGMKLVNLKESRVAYALEGDDSYVKEWEQINYWGDTNTDRVHNMAASIARLGYCPEKGSYIVVYEDGGVIVDGCHRAACALQTYGNIKVKVARWHSKDGRYSQQNIVRELERERDKYRNRKKAAIERKKLVRMLIRRDLNGRKVLIKGGGKHTEELLQIMDLDQLHICGIVDKNVSGNKYGYPMIKEEEIWKSDAEVILISSYKYREEMKEDMERYSDKMMIYDIYEHGIDREFFSI